MLNKLKAFSKHYWPIFVLSLIIGSIMALALVKQRFPYVPTDRALIPQALNLIDVFPKPPFFESAWSTELIKFSFDQPLDPETIKYSVNPEENTRLIVKPDSPNSFSILPLTGWEENQEYSITVFKNLSSKNGYKLNNDISVTLTRRFPQNFVGPDESQEYPENR